MTSTTFAARDLELELLDPGSRQLVRLFKHDGGEWEPTPEIHRGERTDPPPGHKHRYAFLYTADALSAVAVECRILSADAKDDYVWSVDLARQYGVARYRFDQPALFVPLDGDNRRTLALEAAQRLPAAFGKRFRLPYQEVALTLFERFGSVVHGLSWESFHRHQPGRVYALWHHHKSTIALSLISTAPYAKLPDDPEWQQFLLDHPDVEAIDASP